MVSFDPTLRRAYLVLIIPISLYLFALVALTNPWLQRHVLYAHKVDKWWQDLNKPEQFGFAKNQVTPFNFTTPDNETIYAWHVIPLGLYVKHEDELLHQPSGFAEEVTRTTAFKLLSTDPEARLVINFHGNAGSVAQGWRTDIYRSISHGSTPNIHVIAPDYRGYGYSSGSPSEVGIITDAVTTVNWALNVAKVPPQRIVIVGHSLGTGVASAVVERFSKDGIEFSGVVLVAAFKDIPTLLTDYAIGGWIPLLAPLKNLPMIQKFFLLYVADTWASATSIANYVRISKRVRLYIIHSRDDYEIPCTHSDLLFAAAANATTSAGMDIGLLERIKSRQTVDIGDGSSLSTWNSGDDRIIEQQIVAHGGHTRVMTYAPVALAILKAFNMDGGMKVL